MTFKMKGSPHKTGEIIGSEIDMNKVYVRNDEDYVSPIELNDSTVSGNVSSGGTGNPTSRPGSLSTKALDNMVKHIENMPIGENRTEALRVWRNKKNNLTLD